MVGKAKLVSLQNIIESAVNCLAAAFRFHGVSTDRVTFRQNSNFISANATQDDLVRQARRHGLKSRLVQGQSWPSLAITSLPAIGRYSDGQAFFILARFVGNKALILDSLTQKPELLTRDQFEAIWDGSLILITKRASLADLDKTFNISWFLTAVKKYRHLLGEVLIGSFMLNIFGLVSALFFQVVVDKVLVHRDMSTLDVLISGWWRFWFLNPYWVCLELACFATLQTASI